MTGEFWDRCANAGCVVVAVEAYRKYGDDGNVHEQDFEGIKFAAIGADTEAVGTDDYWFMVDDAHTGPLFDSPEAALDAYLAKVKRCEHFAMTCRLHMADQWRNWFCRQPLQSRKRIDCARCCKRS